MMRFGFANGSLNMEWRYDYDINIYYLIGYGWLHGILPYEGLSDLKGPIQFLWHGIGSCMSPGDFCGEVALQGALLGIGLLYAWKIACLYVEPRLAFVVTGLITIYVPYMSGNPVEFSFVLEFVTMYYVLAWAEGKWEHFLPHHLFVTGFSVAIVLLTKFNYMVFWVPIALLMLYVCRQCFLRSLLWLVAGFLLPVVPFVLYFVVHGILSTFVQEYFVTAVIYGSAPFSASALVQKNWRLLEGVLPAHVAGCLPTFLTCLASFLLLTAWIRGGYRRTLVITTLFISLLLGVYVSFIGYYSFGSYYIYFYPFVFLSLVTIVRCTAKMVRSRLFWGCVGLAPFVFLGMSISLPIYVSYFKTSMGTGELRQNISTLSAFLRAEGDDFLVIDAQNLLVLYRKTGTLPPIRHLVPQMIPHGEDLYREELVEYIRSHRPTYLISTDWDSERTVYCLGKAGVEYEQLTPAELGLVAFPSTTKYAMPVVWRLRDTSPPHSCRPL